VSMRNGLRSPSGCLFLYAPGRFARPVDACFFTLPVGSPLATEMARDADVLGALVGALEDGSCLGSVPTLVVMMSRCCTRTSFVFPGAVRCAGCRRLVGRSVLRDAVSVEGVFCPEEIGTNGIFVSSNVKNDL
jgi:hypothetical protein